jgi:hypothetical protein
MAEANQWRVSDGCLHIGETICMGVPSYRYSESLEKIRLFTHLDHPDYCFVYSTELSLFDVWKYKMDNKNTIAGTTGSFDGAGHIKHIARRRHCPVNIESFGDNIILQWNGACQSVFYFANENIIDEFEILDGPKRRFSDVSPHMMTLRSSCDKYCIVQRKDSEIFDVFNTETDLFLFGLTHNMYKSSVCCTIVEFAYTANGDLRIFINDEHACIGIYDMSGNTCHSLCDSDDFFTKMTRVVDDGKEYLVVYGFIWSPVHFMAIYEIEKMVTDASYEPDKYWEGDFEDFEAFNMTPNQFKTHMIEKRARAAAELKQRMDNAWTNRTNPNIIRRIFENTEDVNEDVAKYISNLLAENICPDIVCFGGQSDMEFKEHASRIITNPVNNDKKDAIVIDAIARIIFSDDYETYAVNGSGLKQSNLIFTFNDILQVNIVIQMVQISDDSYWFPAHDSDVKFVFSLKREDIL